MKQLCLVSRIVGAGLRCALLMAHELPSTAAEKLRLKLLTRASSQSDVSELLLSTDSLYL